MSHGAENRWTAPSSHWPGFFDLVRRRVHHVLLVATPYESFILAQDGQLQELMLDEFKDLIVRHIPGITHVSSGAEALAAAGREPRPDLVVTSIHVGDMDAVGLAHRLRESGIDSPVVVLAYDEHELKRFEARTGLKGIERAFLWQGEARILPTIIKDREDRLNAPHDVGAMGVQAILVVEDRVKSYSSFLPVIYAEVIAHSRRLMPESLNQSHRLLRSQARPKILLATSFEEAWRDFSSYDENVLGVISDVEFPKDGALCRDAGVQLAALVRETQHDVPIILHSRDPEHRKDADAMGSSFLLKGSPRWLQELRQLMTAYFSFGDFVFRTPEGAEIGRARDLRELETALATVDERAIVYHAQRNHFSRWLKARTEFALAQKMRPRTVSEFATVADLRQQMIRWIRDYSQQRQRITVSDFDARSFDPNFGFTRIGSGSLGGKARGLAFVNLLLDEHDARDRFPGARVFVPPAVVIATGVFDDFLERNGLRDFAIETTDDEVLRERFLAAELAPEVSAELAAFLEVVREPLAVRSSSLLEDSQYQPFAGIYDTHMIANDHAELATRRRQLARAIKLVYASTFWRRARAYLDATGYRLEEEKMAVVLQRLVGARHGQRFYPDFAGVARSHNFYPIAPARSQDGIAAVALGFGETVVDGEACVRFCPHYPQSVVSFSSVEDVLKNSQRSFYALELGGAGEPAECFDLKPFALQAAEVDGTLAAVGSTYSRENHAVYDGIGRAGVRLVSFAGVLKHEQFPLAPILAPMLQLGADGMGGPVELEFAVNLWPQAGGAREFAFLQLRPLALLREAGDLELNHVEADRVLCRSAAVLGHGRIEDIHDLVVVDYHHFDRARSQDVAAALARINAQIVASSAPYLLIGVGRWGSRDPHLGIPVSWDQISGARVIVEAGFRDFKVTPSQGTHFFQNLNASHVGYFTVNPEAGEGTIDWDWLAARPAVSEDSFVRHLRFAHPLVIVMNGRENEGVILKPPI